VGGRVGKLLTRKKNCRLMDRFCGAEDGPRRPARFRPTGGASMAPRANLPPSACKDDPEGRVLRHLPGARKRKSWPPRHITEEHSCHASASKDPSRRNARGRAASTQAGPVDARGASCSGKPVEPDQHQRQDVEPAETTQGVHGDAHVESRKRKRPQPAGGVFNLVAGGNQTSPAISRVQEGASAGRGGNGGRRRGSARTAKRHQRDEAGRPKRDRQVTIGSHVRPQSFTTQRQKRKGEGKGAAKGKMARHIGLGTGRKGLGFSGWALGS